MEKSMTLRYCPIVSHTYHHHFNTERFYDIFENYQHILDILQLDLSYPQYCAHIGANYLETVLYFVHKFWKQHQTQPERTIVDDIDLPDKLLVHAVPLTKLYSCFGVSEPDQHLIIRQFLYIIHLPSFNLHTFKDTRYGLLFIAMGILFGQMTHKMEVINTIQDVALKNAISKAYLKYSWDIVPDAAAAPAVRRNCVGNTFPHMFIIPQHMRKLYSREQLIKYREMDDDQVFYNKFNIDCYKYTDDKEKIVVLPLYLSSFAFFNNIFQTVTNPQPMVLSYFDCFTRYNDDPMIYFKKLNTFVQDITAGSPLTELQIQSYEIKKWYTCTLPYLITLSGVAAVGKSTFIYGLESQHQIVVLSRSDLGTFSCKLTNPAAIANLNCAFLGNNLIENSSYIVYDRNLFDNIIWRFIMIIVDPQVPYNVWLPLFIKFMRTSICRTTYEYFARNITFFVLESNEMRNKERMMARGTDGDLFRHRISRYVVAQNFAYYASAILFGWNVYFTRYDPDDGSLINSHYTEHIRENILKLRGEEITRLREMIENGVGKPNIIQPPHMITSSAAADVSTTMEEDDDDDDDDDDIDEDCTVSAVATAEPIKNVPCELYNFIYKEKHSDSFVNDLDFNTYNYGYAHSIGIYK